MISMNKKKYRNMITDDGGFAFCDVPLMWAAAVIPPMLGRCVPLCGGIGGDLSSMLMRAINPDTLEWIEELFGGR